MKSALKLMGICSFITFAAFMILYTEVTRACTLVVDGNGRCQAVVDSQGNPIKYRCVEGSVGTNRCHFQPEPIEE